MFPTAPSVASANEAVFELGLNDDQLAWFKAKGAAFAESNVDVALVNMFIRRLVPVTNCSAPTGGVKFAVYIAVPFTIRTFPMKPV